MDTKKELSPGDIINFGKPKQYEYLKELGYGGTGQTILVKDKLMDMNFCIKKYRPIGSNIKKRSELYVRFTNEIKMLFKLSHDNIVRVFDYELYPEQELGYIQMEYISGVTIDKYVEANPNQIEYLFRKAIDAFICLERNQIYHRDIKSSNILINDQGELKVIDFGFSKVLDENQDNENSIFLNWPVTTLPSELRDNYDYTLQTEIFFVGTLFKQLISDNKIEIIRYHSILNKMVRVNVVDRYLSFIDINKDIFQGNEFNFNFTISERKSFQNFVSSFLELMVKYTTPFEMQTDISSIITDLEDVITNNTLNEAIVNKRDLINCFLKNNYTYSSCYNFSLTDVKNFYNLLAEADTSKQGIIMGNLRSNLETIRIDYDADFLPF